MAIDVHQFPCLSDNYGFLVRDGESGLAACVDTPDAKAVLAVEGVAGLEEGGLAVGAEHEAGVGDAGDVAVDDRVLPAHGRDVDASHVELVAGDQRPGPSAEIDCVDDAGLHCDDGVRVGRQQCRDALGVDVVGVVMRHQDGVQAGESVPRGAEVARIDEDAGARRLDEHGRVTQVRELPADHPTRCLWRGQA